MNKAQLIEKIATIDAIKRIRYTTSHPLDMNDQLIEAHRDIEKLMPFLHLPVQSGSNKILQAMNRKHHREDYFRIIDKLRTARPDIGLSSDLTLVGTSIIFSSETTIGCSVRPSNSFIKGVLLISASSISIRFFDTDATFPVSFSNLVLSF